MTKNIPSTACCKLPLMAAHLLVSQPMCVDCGMLNLSGLKMAQAPVKLSPDWMTDGVTQFLIISSIDVARYYPFQQKEQYIEDRCYEIVFKIYNPPVHNREPYTAAREYRKSPFYQREVALGGISWKPLVGNALTVTHPTNTC